MERYELVVVGGGMAGLTAIASLKPTLSAGMKVALIDPGNKPSAETSTSPSFDDRATALSGYTLQLLENLGLTQISRSVTNISAIEVSDEGHAGFHMMNAAVHGRDHFGAVIANKVLGHHLWQHVKTLPVDWLFGSGVNKITPDEDGHELVLTNGNHIHARLVILCDGGRSGLHNQLGLSEKTFDFDAVARIATVKTTEAHNGVAFERFSRSGPVALLPFGEYSALVWSAKKEHLSSLQPADALQWLNQHFGQRLGKITEISSMHEYPLVEKQLIEPLAHGFIALGNAAATLHPVAGQGFNLATRGLARVSGLINESYLKTAELPSFNQLQSIVQLIKADQQSTVLFSRELINTFQSESPVVQLARGLGLNSMDRHPLLSQAFSLAGMGFIQDAPLKI